MKIKPQKVLVRSVSVKGSLHRHKKMPCQDYAKHAAGKNFVAVVSDGAGSAKYGKIGARIVCETLCDLLKNSSFKEAREAVLRAIHVSREKLALHRYNRKKDESGLSPFAATVVGVICYQNQGLFFHIGDGAGIALKSVECDDFVISRPSNGNFACETFFYTMEDWRHNLRFTPFEGAKNLLLMSDGLTNFAFSCDYRQVEAGFVKPIVDFLNNERVKARAVRALSNTLNTPKAQRLNVDDKTLLWARL